VASPELLHAGSSPVAPRSTNPALPRSTRDKRCKAWSRNSPSFPTHYSSVTSENVIAACFRYTVLACAISPADLEFGLRSRKLRHGKAFRQPLQVRTLPPDTCSLLHHEYSGNSRPSKDQLFPEEVQQCLSSKGCKQTLVADY
jgi:hypothetical protein